MKNRYLLIGLLFILIISITACGSKTVVANTQSGDQSLSAPTSPSSPQNITAPQAAGTAPAVASSSSKSNPAPVGSGILADSMEIVVTGKVRPADTIVAKGNMFTNTPVAGQEYMIVNISVFCQQAAGKQCNFDTYNFKALGSDGALNSFVQTTGVDGLLKYTTFDGGSAITGILPFLVTKNDPNILLVYQPSSGDASYLALP